MVGCKCDPSRSEAQEVSLVRTLESYCKSEPCERYEHAIAMLESRTRLGSGCMVAETGSCGSFRYVRYSDGYWGYTQYFRASGPMVGAQTWSDIADRKNLGAVPSCTPVIERRLCGTPDSGR
jgi:hypothetical protein